MGTTSRHGRRSWRSGLWEDHDSIFALFSDASGADEARANLLAYLGEREEALHQGAVDLDHIEWAHALEAIRVLRTMASPESEAIVGFSTVELLWASSKGDGEFDEGFNEEFEHLFRAIHGESGIGQGWYGHLTAQHGAEEDFPGSGRSAGRRRSRRLDHMAARLWAEVERHPDGTSVDVVARRKVNRERILAFFGGSGSEWADAAWQAAHVICGEAGVRILETLVPLSGDESAALRLASRYDIPWGITPYYLALFDFDSHDRKEDAQVRAQVLPSIHTVRTMVEHRRARGRADDFMRESDTSPADRITRRYPAVAIFKVCDTCPQICTYCQRNWLITGAMDAAGIPSASTLEENLEWFTEHPHVTDVLLTGGDPLVLDNEVLGRLLSRLSELDHISSIRVGTRTPVTMPMRIDGATARLLGSYVRPGRRSIEVMTHVQSAYEVTPELVAAVARLRARQIPVYNQQVLSLEASRRFQAVSTRVALRRAGIDPYYTFYPKGKDEHRDALVPIARLLQERKEEARLLPGIFRTDEPVFNVPGLGKNHLRARQDREFIGIRADGRRVYLFHPWEKGIAPVAPWPYTDVSIHGYLRRLERLGEDPADYESIWYYY